MLKLIRRSLVALTIGAIGATLAISTAAAVEPGTVEIAADIRAGEGDSDPSGFVALGGWMYFAADDGVHGREVWRTDGTVSEQVEDLRPGADGSEPLELTVFEGWLYFTAEDGASGRELWRSDGEVVERVLGAADGFVNPAGLISTGSALLFEVVPVGSSSLFTEVWSVVDGTASVVATADSVNSQALYGAPKAVVGDWAYFGGGDATNSHDQLWRTDGVEVEEIPPPEDGMGFLYGAPWSVADGKVFLSTSKGLWSVDGVVLELLDFPFVETFAVMLGDEMFFVDRERGTGLYRLGEGDVLEQIHSGPVSPYELTVFDGWLYFVEVDSILETGVVFRTNGDTVEEIQEGASNSPGMFVFDVWMYFRGADGAGLWRTNGTDTVLLSSEVTVQGEPMAGMDGWVYFAGDDGRYGTEPWRVFGGDPAPAVFTVTFDPGNGDAPTVVEVTEGDQVTEPAAPTREGYEFQGWVTGADDPWDFTDPVSETMTLTALWEEIPEPVMFTVTFDPGNGDDVMTVEVTEGDPVAAPADPVRDGYEFQGWVAEGGDVWDFTVPVTGDLTLTASWEEILVPVVFTVTLDPGNGDEPVVVEVTEGGTIPEPAMPTREGYDFLGWVTDDNQLWDFADPVTEDLTLSASWEVQDADTPGGGDDDGNEGDGDAGDGAGADGDDLASTGGSSLNPFAIALPLLVLGAFSLAASRNSARRGK